MPMIRITAAAVVMALGLVTAGSSAALAQAANCTWYADTALKQQQQNEYRKCGFLGSEWSSNKQAHLSWCATQPPDRWKAEAQKREQMLAGCKK
jgi:hypothetical protein